MPEVEVCSAFRCEERSGEMGRVVLSLAIKAGSTVTVRYTGLGFAPAEVSVRFE
jgi:hypothetical protein